MNAKFTIAQLAIKVERVLTMTVFDAAVDSIEDLFASANYQECEDACNLVLSIQNSNPVGLYYSGKLNELVGNVGNAADYYQRLALIFPFNSEYVALALRTLSYSAGDSAALEGKIEASRKSITGFPNRPALRYCENDLGRFAVPAHPSNDQIANKICEGKIFEPEIIEVAKKYIKPGTTVIDVGANLGQMSLVFADMVGKDGRVYSIEADDYLHYILGVNVALNQVSNVISICNAAHEHDGEEVRFPVQDLREYHCYGAFGLDPNATSGRSVKTITIDSLQIDSPVSFMKVDVQGADLFALRGAVNTISRHQCPIIFEYEEEFQGKFKTSFQDYVDFVAGIGYKFAYTVRDINYVIVPKP